MAHPGGGNSAFSKVSGPRGKAVPVKAKALSAPPVAAKASAPRRPSGGGSVERAQPKLSGSATPSNAASGEGKDKVQVNRKLLHNLFAGLGPAGSDDDDDDDDDEGPAHQAEFDDGEQEMMTSFRQIPGTPKAGQRRGNVPTISSPAATKKPVGMQMLQAKAGAPTISAASSAPKGRPSISSQNPPTGNATGSASSSSAKGSSAQHNPPTISAAPKGYSAQNNAPRSAAYDSSPRSSYAAQNASKRDPSPGGAVIVAKSKAPSAINTSLNARAPPPALSSPSAASVADGYYEAPPARLPSPKVISGAYNRPVPAPAPLSSVPLTGPMQSGPSKVVTGTGGGPIGRSAPGIGQRGGVGYANRMTPTKQPAVSASALKPAAAPRCGPKAFDLLRKLDAENEKANDDAGSEFTEEGNVFFDEYDEHGAGDTFLPQDDGLVDKFPGSALDNGTPASGPAPEAVDSPGPGLAPSRESASEYVERLKRGLQKGEGRPVSRGQGEEDMLPMEDEDDGEDELAAYRRDIQLREAGMAAANKAKAAAAKASACPPAPQIQIENKKPATQNDELSDSDDESAAPMVQFESGPGGPGGGGPIGGMGAGVGDVKSMVQQFAREERARNAGGRPKGKPPAAPHRSNSPAAAQAAAASPKAPDPNALRAEQNPEERLFFSRKARAVDYQPASVAEYKDKYKDRNGKEEYKQLGSLGADLDDENLLMKHAVQEKVKQFSKELHRINRERQAASRPVEKPKPEPKPKPTARAKAAEFAKRVPKPQPKPTPPKPPRIVEKEPEKDEEREADLADWAEITRREAQHFLDKEKAQEIKAFLAQVAVKG